MATPAEGVSVNPADETIHLGPLTLHFLVTGEQSACTVAVFELMVRSPTRDPPHLSNVSFQHG